jgi:hypothetical protein
LFWRDAEKQVTPERRSLPLWFAPHREKGSRLNVLKTSNSPERLEHLWGMGQVK